MSARPSHRCEDRDCPYIGQPSPRSCLCHKTTEQLLTEQRDGLVDLLTDAIDFMRGNISGPAQRDGILKEADALLARARGEQP